MPSIKYFELNSCCLQPSLRSSQPINNSLKTIVLLYVTVSPGAVECILSDCLSLESLTISVCKCPPRLRICGPHLELKSLYINACVGVEEIEMYATKLVVFEFRGQSMANFIFDHVPQLESVYLYIMLNNIFPYVCGRLASDLPHLKSLNFVSMGAYGDIIRDMEINMFSNLRRLDIDIHHLPKIDLRLLTSILQYCPLVQKFHLNVHISGKLEAEKQEGSVVAHSELKEMEISGFGATEYEMEFALYILKSAINLEKMHVSRCFIEYDVYDLKAHKWSVRPHATPWSEEMEETIHTKLQGQAVSKIAQVIIQHKSKTPHFQD